MDQLFLVRARVQKLIGNSNNTFESAHYVGHPSHPERDAIRLVRARNEEAAARKFVMHFKDQDEPLLSEHSVRGIEVTSVIE